MLMSSATIAGGAGSTLSAALQFFTTTQCLLTESWPPNASLQEDAIFDVIIIGGGTAGTTLAARLSEVSLKILLVEAGPDPPQESIIPGMRDLMKASRFDWNFTSVRQNNANHGLLNGQQKLPRGKMLGGSGSINDMVYARGFPHDYYEWAEIAGETWNWTNVLNYFKKTEKLTDEKIIDDPELTQYHGFDGEIEVSGSNNIGNTSERILEAFKELGFDIVDDMTNPKKIGAGRFSHTIRNGRRDSSLVSLLNTAGNRSNLFVLKNTMVTKILIENDAAKGIEALSLEGEKLTYFARKEVVVSAGTYNTPKLLTLSGIGPRDELEFFGIKAVQDLPVGENLQDHVMVMTYIAADEGTCNTTVAGNYMEIIKYFYDQSGTYSMSNSIGAYIANSNVPEFALYPTCVPVKYGFYEGCTSVLGVKENICEQLDGINQKSELISVAVVLLKPKTKGKVQLYGPDPLNNPRIDTFLDVVDLQRFPEALKIANSLANTSYFISKGAYPIRLNLAECSEYELEDDWLECWALSMATSAWHAVGTAALGAVVDKDLFVHGVSNLRVVDASVMPTVPRGNTNAPVVMIAEIAADLMKQKLGYNITINNSLE